jgi:glycine hydroxymethyltransferase
MTTHKTLRGPRGGAILSSASLGKRVDAAVAPGVQGDPLPNVVAAKAVAFREAMLPEFAAYAQSVVGNARALGAALIDRGFRLVTGGTDTHMMLIDHRSVAPELTAREAIARLDQVGITVTRCELPGDVRWPEHSDGIKVGTASVTTLGMQATDMDAIAELLRQTLASDSTVNVAALRRDVRRLRA